MVAAWVAAGLFCIFLCCNWTSLRVSVEVIKVTSDWVADTKRLMFMPLGTLIMGLFFFILWSYGFACVASVADETIVA